MNVLIVVNSLEKGGRTKHIAEEKKHLALNGHRVTLLCLDEVANWVKEQFPSLDQTVVIKKNQKRIDLGLIFKISKLILKTKVEIVHAHCEASALYAGMAAKIARRPVAMTFHRSELKYFQKTRLNRWTYSLVDHFFAISHDRRNKMIERLDLAEEKTSLLHWGVEIEAIDTLHPKDYARDAVDIQGRLVLSLGHLGPIKGHDDSIRAMSIVRDSLSDVTLAIGGSGSDQDEKRIKALIHELNLEDKVLLLGQVEDTKLWMRACDIFLQPSIEEGFGLVFLEAGECERPIVATKVGGIPDIVQHGHSGYLVPPNSPEKIAKAILDMFGNDTNRIEMGLKGRKIIIENFQLQASIEKLEQKLKKLIF